jgi:hypothetical protein
MSGYLNYFQAYSDRYSSNFYKRSLRVKKETPLREVSFDDECDRYTIFTSVAWELKETPRSGVSFGRSTRSLQQQFIQAWLES